MDNSIHMGFNRTFLKRKKEGKYMFVDSHAHLQWKSFEKDLDTVIEKAVKAGVEKIITIGTSLLESKKGVQLARRCANVYATVGIHPHNAKYFNNNVARELKQMAEDPKVVAIGEIGLDYYRNLSSRQAQQEAFKAQLLLAKELQLPVVIHDREAHADVLKTISECQSKIEGVMHCFSGSKEMAVQSIANGFYISFAGNITFPKAVRLQEIAASLELDKILVETDCPWLAPQKIRGKRNEPAFLTYTVEEIANLKNIPLEKVAKATTQNAYDIFKLV
ncbi:MAG: TatD family hydrolase [Candidatus Bathyarchaeota archaeon]|jgi:TatD DNase family protein